MEDSKARVSRRRDVAGPSVFDQRTPKIEDVLVLAAEMDLDLVIENKLPGKLASGSTPKATRFR